MAFDIGTAKAAAAARGVQAPPDYPGGPDAWVMEWFKNGIAAGDPDLQQRSGGMPGQRQAEGGGIVNDFSQAAGSADWLGKRKPTTQELRKWAKDTGRSEDYERFSDAAVSGMIDRNWDVNAGSFRNNYGDLVDKPDERGPNTPAGVNGTGDRGNYGAGGGGGGGGGGGYGGGAGGYSAGPGGSAGGLPQFNAPTFTPPTAEQAFNDPGYQFALKEGVRGLEGSAAARGTLRTGGTLKDIMDYGQKAAAQQYGDVYNRAANTFGINYQGAKDEFAPQYGGWQTMYGGDLQKYLQGQQSDLSKWSTRYGGDLSRDLQRESNIYGIINQPPPAPPSWQS